MKKALIALVLIVVAFLGFVATRPSEFTVERKTTIAASPDVVFSIVNDFHRYGEWNPWGDKDPAMKVTMGGAASGTGASYAWVGNDKAGEGKMTITSSTPQKIGISLEFIKPFPSTNELEYSMTPNGANTDFSWKMHGPANFLLKAMTTFKSMDAMIGPDFEKGLASLKKVAEADAKKKAEDAAKAAAAAPPPSPDTAPAPAVEQK